MTFESEDFVDLGNPGDGSEGCFMLNGYLEVDSGDVLLGDVNLDGIVNLLDVAPFVDRVSNGVFQSEADVNQDGLVNLLDVAPFVQILTGG